MVCIVKSIASKHLKRVKHLLCQRSNCSFACGKFLLVAKGSFIITSTYIAILILCWCSFLVSHNAVMFVEGSEGGNQLFQSPCAWCFRASCIVQITWMVYVHNACLGNL